MNEDEVLSAVRRSLTVMRDSLDGVRMERPVEALVARGRASRARRSLAVRAAVACGTVGVTAAAVVAVTAGASGTTARTGTSVARARMAAYVIRRVETALAETRMVMQTVYTFSPDFPATMQWTYRQNVRAVQSGFISPATVEGLPWAQGQESWAVGTATIKGKLTYVQVDYRHHEWFATPPGEAAPSDCSIGLDIIESGGAANWPAYIRQALSCGLFKVAGHARVDGEQTVMITGSMTWPHWWASLPHGDGSGALQIDAALYVDPSTYLPVRMIWRNLTHWANGRPRDGTVREDIRLLPPTPRNVAEASVIIPAGFRQVSGNPFGGPIFQFYG
jgi:hypothetical protein